jgi:hypothetical protein
MGSSVCNIKLKQNQRDVTVAKLRGKGMAREK